VVAAPLVIFNGLAGRAEAMKLSFSACMRNSRAVPESYGSLVLGAWLVVAAIPLPRPS